MDARVLFALMSVAAGGLYFVLFGEVKFISLNAGGGGVALRPIICHSP